MVANLQTSTSLEQDLRTAVADLHGVHPGQGLRRFLLIGSAVVGLSAIAWQAPNPFLFTVLTVMVGIAYAFWLISTHDATHRTLTGWRWFDTLMPRLISWPMVWPFGTYALIHRLHHGWNGTNLRDPERIQWTLAEYQQASALLRWYARHQWMIDIFVLSGLGLIVKTLLQGLSLQEIQPRLRLQLALDLSGIILIQSSLIALAYVMGYGILKYLLFWLLIERTVGIIIQTRDHLEPVVL
ncbi:MAG: hypothetical protein F6J97_23565 [Leptolyngbya sp. SIO4C1]|nr:hypothetical protein [Leptolyngbya sp. SIO4C1]